MKLFKRIINIKFILILPLVMMIMPVTNVYASIITEFPVPNATPNDICCYTITSGPDGNIWFPLHTGQAEDNIERITPTGVISGFSIPTNNSAPYGITSGPDGNLWFTEQSYKIGRITTNGAISEFELPDNNINLSNITSGPDGNLWFTERNGGKIGRITPSGVITEFTPPTIGNPSGITTGPDGNLWFVISSTDDTGTNIDRIDKMTINGTTFTEYPVPNSNTGGGIFNIIAGPDGNLWFPEVYGQIGKITTDGHITEYPVPSSDSYPYDITKGPDGNIWFTEEGANKIGRITTNGIITEYPIPTNNNHPFGITSGPDGNIWFTEAEGQIGRVNLSNLGSALNVPLLKQGVFPYDDNNPSWEGEEFDHSSSYGGFGCGTTIAQCGCAMTSTAMVFQYYGITKLPDSTPLDPGTFNTWLKNNNGYFRDEGLNPYVAATLANKAKSQNPAFTYDGLEYSRVDGADTSQLTEDLQNGFPDVLEELGHFIVGTGIDGDSFTINDPFHDRSSLTAYNNSFLSLGRFIPSHTDLSYIVLAVDKDVDVSLVNSNGESVGNTYMQYHLNNATMTTDPTSTQPSLKILSFAKPPTGSYQIQISTPQSQAYQLDSYLITQGGDTKLNTFTGEVVPNVTNSFSLSFDKQSTQSGTVDPMITLVIVKSDLQKLYAQGLIDNQGVYNTLRLEIDAAIQASNIHPQNLAKQLTLAALKIFKLELTAQRGKHVKEVAYQVLNNETNYLIQKYKN